MKRLALLFLLAPAFAFAQSSPDWPLGYQPSLAEWNAEWASKLDASFSATSRFASPGPIGNTAASTGAFTTLSASLNATVAGTFGVTSDTTLSGTLGVIGIAKFISTDWMTPLLNWPVPSSHMPVLHPGGGMSIMGASETVDGPGGSYASIGISGFGFNNRTTPTQAYAWGGYFEARQYPLITSATFGVETEIANVSGSDSLAVTPYAIPVGTTYGHMIGSGADVASDTPALTAHAATAAIFIENNGAAFKSGIVFGATSISGTNGADSNTGEAIALATGQIIRWYQPSAAVGGGFIYSSQTSGSSTGIVFGNSGTGFTDASSGTPGSLFTVTNGNPGAAATSVAIRATNTGGTSLVAVTLGATDSGGTGYRSLRVPN